MWVRAVLLAACLFATLCWIRFLLQAAKLPHSHPLLRLCRRATDFLVEPLRAAPPTSWLNRCAGSSRRCTVGTVPACWPQRPSIMPPAPPCYG